MTRAALLCVLVLPVLPAADTFSTRLEAARKLAPVEALAALAGLAQSSRDANRPTDEARALQLAGAVAQGQEDLRTAAQFFERAAALFTLARNDESAAAAEIRLARLYLDQSRFPEALGVCQRARGRAEKHEAQRWAAETAREARLVEATVYKTLGREEKALELLRGARSTDVAAQLQLGELYRRLGDPVKAEEILERAAAGFDDRPNATRIALLLELGAIEAQDLSKFGKAFDTFGTARESAEWAGQRREGLYARLARGEVKYLDGFDDDAEIEWRDAMWVARDSGSAEGLWRALHGLGRVAERRADVAGALRLFQDAVEVLESPKARVEPRLGGPAFLPKWREAYDSAVGLLLASTDDNVDARVLDLMERSRASANVAWLLAARRPDLAALEARIRLAAARRLRLRQPSAKAADQELARLAADCLRLQPELAPTATVAIAKVQSLLARDTALVSYWMGASQAGYVWITSQSSGRVVHSFGDDERGKLHQFAYEVSHAGSGNIEALGRELGELLTNFPFGTEIRRLYIVPDGPLTEAPFELLAFRNKPLLDNFEIGYLPSAAALVRTPRPRRTLFPWDTQLKIIAGPAGFVSPGPFTLLPQDEHWNKTPGPAAEPNRIARFLTGRSDTLLGGQARIAAWKDPRRVPVLHLVTQGAADRDEPARSRLLVASDDSTHRVEYAFAADLRRLDLTHLDLVTLPHIEDDGARHFGDAMLSAGARAAVTPLWTPAEGAASELMAQFYYFLGTGLTKAGALRAAKLKLARSKSALSHPAHWSGFVLTGEGFEPLPTAWSWTVLLLVAAGLVAGAGFALSLLLPGDTNRDQA